MQSLSKSKSQKLKSLLKHVKNIVILTHTGLDPDAQGSSLGLYYILSKTYRVKPLYFEDLIDIKFVPNVKLNYAEEIDNATNLINNADLIFITDTADLDRTSRSVQVTRALEKKLNKIVVIDHHATRSKIENKAALVIKEPHASCAQMVYFIFAKSLKKQINKKAAMALLFGILGDTRNFRYLPTTESYILGYVQDLLPKIKGYSSLKEIMYAVDVFLPTDALKFVGEVLKNIKVDGKIAGVYIDNDKLKELGLTEKQLDAVKLYILHYILELLDGIEIFFTLRKHKTEKSTYVASLRSKKSDQDVSKIAEYFGGGGHKNAAGCKLKAKNYKQAFSRVLKKLKEV